MDGAGESTGTRALSVVLRDAASVQQYFMPRIRGGGVLVETPNPLPMGTEVLLMISLPDNQPRAPVTGRVVWVMPKGNQQGHPAAMGIGFTNDRSGVLTRIQNILSGLPDYTGPIRTF